MRNNLHVNRHPGITMGGRGGFAQIGAVVMIALAALVGGVAAPQLTAERQNANESSTVVALQLIVAAQQHFMTNGPDLDGNPDAARNLQELARFQLVDDVLGATSDGGYDFDCTSEPGGAAWECTADPVTEGSSGKRHFFVDESGVIRSNQRKEADANDTPLERRGVTGGAAPDRKDKKVKAATIAIIKIDRLLGRQGIAAARAMLDDPTAVAEMLSGLDAVADGQLSMMEVLGADVFALGGLIGFNLDPTSPAAGDPTRLRKAVDKFSDTLVDRCKLGSGEQSLPSIPAAELDIDAAKAMLDRLLS